MQVKVAMRSGRAEKRIVGSGQGSAAEKPRSSRLNYLFSDEALMVLVLVFGRLYTSKDVCKW